MRKNSGHARIKKVLPEGTNCDNVVFCCCFLCLLLLFRCRADAGPLLVLFGSFLISSTTKKLSELDPLWQNLLGPCMVYTCNFVTNHTCECTLSPEPSLLALQHAYTHVGS